MAIRFMEGFDGVLSATQLVRKWGAVFGTPTLQASGRNGGGNILLVSGSNMEVGVVIENDTIVFGAAINPIAPRTANANLFDISGRNGAVQIRLRLNSSDSKIEILRSGITSIGFTDVALLSGTYTYVETKLFCHNSIGTIEIRFDNVRVFTFGPGDTQGTTEAFINSLQVQGDSGAGIRMDDLYVADSSGTNNNDFQGNVRVDTLVPTVDDVAEFDTTFPASPTNHFSKVDEITGVDEDTTYNETPINGDRDIFEMSNLPVHPVPAVVVAVQPWSYAKKQQTADASVRHLVEPLVTIFNQLPQGGNAEDWHVMQNEILEDNPETSAAWLESEVDAAKFGMEVV